MYATSTGSFIWHRTWANIKGLKLSDMTKESEMVENFETIQKYIDNEDARNVLKIFHFGYLDRLIHLVELESEMALIEMRRIFDLIRYLDIFRLYLENLMSRKFFEIGLFYRIEKYRKCTRQRHTGGLNGIKGFGEWNKAACIQVVLPYHKAEKIS